MAAILTVLAAACVGKPDAATRVKGPSVDDFRAIPIVGVDGRRSALSAVLAERPALVSFWAPWCEPCVKELSNLEHLARAMAPCGASVLGVAVGETPAAIMAFTRERQLTYPQFTDEQFHLADALGQTRVPTTVVFDGAQRVIFVGDGLDGRAVTALATALGERRATSGCARSDSF